MSLSLTPKREAFAIAQIETGCASAAYRRAFNAEKMSENAVWTEASRLMKDPKVTLRIEELKQRAMKRHDITLDKLSEMATRAYDMAMKPEVEAPGAAIAAVMALGKLHGLIVDKSKNEHTGKDGLALMPTVNVTITRHNPGPALADASAYKEIDGG